MNEHFKTFLDLSAELRPKHPASLGKTLENKESVFSSISGNIPLLFHVIYSNISGTRRDIKHQELMDFIPGYRLIHIDELTDENNNVASIIDECNIEDVEIAIPFLADYSSNFICYVKHKNGNEGIYLLSNNDGELILKYKNGEDFLNTISAFYRENVYFLDEDGYLDYDMEKESLVGANLNKGIKYWSE